MSLINKMLQDLDARRADATAGGAYGSQIRAVPARRGIHPAWWIALGSGIALAGMLAWMLLRPAPVTVAASRPQLPLKLDSGLRSGQIAASPTGTTESRAAAVAAQMPAPDRGSDERPQEITTVEPAVAADKFRADPDKRIAEKKPALTEKTAARDEPTEPRPQSAAKPSAAAAAPILNKQVKEFTPQQRAENSYRNALLALQQGKAAEATRGLEQALELDPRHAAARQALIGLLLNDKRPDEALRIAREGMALDPAQPGLAMIAARLQLEKGELRPAIETLERTLPHAADRSDYQAFLAALLQRDARHKEAVEHYLLALQRAPQNGVWWMGLGISLQAENRIAEAREAFGRARASNSLTPELLAFVDSKLQQLPR